MTGETVLIVEDDGLIAIYLMELLERAGYRLAGPVSSGKEAIAMAEGPGRPDIILMDIGLEGEIDGIETARKIRERFDIPVIFITAYSSDARIIRAHAVSPYGYIRKPFMEREILTTIGDALGRKTG